MASPIIGTDSRQQAAPLLSWTVHPAAQDRARAAVLALVVLLAALLAWSFTHSALVTAAGVALLLANLSAFFLPRTYVLDASGATERGPLRAERRLAWNAVRSVRRERHGVHLSPLYHPSRWTVDRGIFLRTAGNAEDVMRFTLARQAELGVAPAYDRGQAELSGAGGASGA